MLYISDIYKFLQMSTIFIKTRGEKKQKLFMKFHLPD